MMQAAAERLGLPDRYPVMCPHCHAKSGLPVGVMTVANQPQALRLDFKCGTCHHRWWEQFDAIFAATESTTAAK